MNMSITNRVVAYITLLVFVAGISPTPLAALDATDIIPRSLASDADTPVETDGGVAPHSTPASGEDRSVHLELAHPGQRASGTAKPDANTTIQLGSARLEIPAGAVEHEIDITIEALYEVERLDPGMNNATAGPSGFRFLPAGMEFLRPVYVTLPVDETQVQTEAQWAQLYSYYYNSIDERWVRLERVSVDQRRREVTSITAHFTDMINSTLTLPESPEPLGFDPTSIKSIEAANPFTGIPALEGFEPSAYGSAAFQLPLRLPPGRGGATPRLSLDYSSESTNSWLGRGFDISVSSITIDTSFGLPAYDGDDTYLLDGQELVRVGTLGDAVEYRARTERDFARIRWYRNGGESWWEVTGRDGFVREYGRGEGWIGPARGDRSRTFVWYLTRERDPNGNTVTYAYNYDSVHLFTYLSQIRYSGHQAGTAHTEGPFSVNFVRETERRQDRRSSGRGRFDSKLAWRLDRIDVAYDGEVFRRFVPEYTYNLFGQSQLVSFGETDAAGEVFWEYDFSYYDVPARTDGSGNVVGYDAFGASDVSWGTMDSSRDGLGSDRSFTVGAGLSVGVGVDLARIKRWKRRWKPLLRLTVSGGVSYTNSLTTAALFDINGDGIADAVWRDRGLGGSFRAQLGTPTGFVPDANYSLGGLGDSTRMTASNQLSAYVGVSAVVGQASGGVTRSWSLTDATHGLSDIDGDGRVDVVSAGRGSYHRNTGTAFRNTGYQVESDETPQLIISAEEDEAYQRGYFLQQPLRRWKAPIAGTITIDQTVSAAADGQVSTDGFVARTFAGNTAIDAIAITPQRRSAQSTQSHTVEAGDNLYFLLDTADNDVGDTADWNVQIRYTEIELFAVFTQIPVLADPPEEIDDAVPWANEAYLALYDTAEIPVLDDDGNQIDNFDRHTLRGEWRELVTPELERQFVLDGHFVPAVIPEELFARLLDETPNFLTIDYAEGMDEDGLFGYTPDSKFNTGELITSYRYEPEWNRFVRIDGNADDVVIDYGSTAWTEADERLSLYYTITDPDGQALVPALDQRGYHVNRHAEEISAGANLWDSDHTASTGQTTIDRGTLLDRIQAPTGIREYWLGRDTQGAWTLTTVEADGSETRSAVTPAATTREIQASDNPNTMVSQGGYALTLHDQGVERSYTVWGNTHEVIRIPESLHQSASLEAFAPAIVIEYPRVEVIDGALWANLTAGMESSELADFELLFDHDVETDTRVMNDSATAVDFADLVRQIDALYDDPADVLDRPLYDENADAAFVALTETELADLTTGLYDVSDLAEAFEEITTSDGNVLYIPIIEPAQELRDRIAHAFRVRNRDLAFPWMEQFDSGRYRRPRSDLSPEELDEVYAFFTSIGISVPVGLDRSIRYNADDRLPVHYDTIPSGAIGTQIAPGGSTAGTPLEPGYVLIPTFDAQVSRYRARTIHLFDSGRDFSVEDLITYPVDIFNEENGTLESIGVPDGIDTISRDTEVFRGGVYGWYYGTWSGYYNWNEDRLWELAAPAVPEGEPSLPNYFEPMRHNRLPEEPGTRIVTTSGRDLQYSVSPDAWIGGDSVYAEGSFDIDGNPESVDYTFAPFIDGDLMHPTRASGDTYHRIPRYAGGLAGGSLSDFQSSKARTDNINGGVTFAGFGANFSRSTGTSWQYRSLMDFNGDRYPDLLSINPGRDGASSFSMTPGTGSGFGTRRTIGTRFSHLTRSRNETLGFGGSISGAAVGLTMRFGTSSDVKGTGVTEAEPSLGANGTLGSSIQVQNLTDLNGDGLPDHVNRGGTGAFSVALNTGESTLLTARSWGSGMGHRIVDLHGLGTIEDRAAGLSYTNTASFGGNLSITAGPVTAGVGYTSSSNRTLMQLIDINGDGLADQVIKTRDNPYFEVRFNLGDEFAETTTRLYVPTWSVDFNAAREELENKLGAVFVPIENLGMLSRLIIPGFDGLPTDGGQFRDVINPTAIDDVVSYTASTGLSISGSVEIEIGFNAVLVRAGFTITPGVNASYAQGITSLQMIDLDGDGLPDHVLRAPGSSGARARINAMGRAGLLQSIETPEGGSVSIEYTRVGNTVQNPNSTWTMSAVTRSDGMAGVGESEASYRTDFSYLDGRYDREERKFYGFALVTSANAEGTITRQYYDNDEYWSQGIARQIDTIDAESRVWQRTINQYVPTVKATVDDVQVIFPELVQTTEERFDPTGTGETITTRQVFTYDGYGNVTQLDDLGDTNRGDDDRTIRIRYAYQDQGELIAPYLVSLPGEIVVLDGELSVTRRRSGTYDSRGNLVTQRAWLVERSGSRAAVSSLQWDQYGNLTRVTGPSGYTIDYVYDTDVFTYIASVTDSFGYRSYTVWDYRWGAPVRETDIGGAEMRRDYDAFGRLRRVWGPYDRYPDGTPALTMEYYPDEFPGRAVTHNKVHFDPANDRTIATVIITDGLRRVLQTKADGEVYDPESDRSTIGMSVSGRVEYDEVGRVRAEHQPAFEPGTDYTWTGRSPERRPTIREYDILGRVVRRTLPDTSTTTTAYRIEGGRDVVVSTDPEGRVVRRTSDVRGNIIAVTDYPAGTATTTDYTYNILGEILTVTDPHGNVIASTYDTLGRRTALQTPNSGTVEYSYDLAGNLLTRVDEALRESGGIIRYEYEFNRLTRIRYPESDEVSYEYGEATAGYDAGRTIRVSDQAGITRYRYGAMGETTEITRTLERLTPGREDAPETYTLGYTWDYQGRMERITYPDGEELVYSYDHGGQVARAVGEWGATEYVYVDQIGYDEFGQRNYIRYGNGVETTYSYDPDRRWLDHIHTATGRGEVLQDMDYGFDRVGNILTTINDGERRRVSQSYRYDDRHQLVAADGETIARMGGLELWRNEYSQAYAYDAIGNMVSKTGTNRIMPTGERPEHLNYTLGYTYDALRPHQATVIGDREYRYDLNGNVREVIRAGTGSEGGGHDPSAYRDLGEHRGHAPEAFGRFGAGGGEEPERIARYEWNEENRLVESETGDGIVARYRYDANGIRSTRYSALYGETLYADRMYQENFGANPPALATKHIFVGETRIASKLHYRDQTGGTRALFMERNTYWYHADHLGSTNWVTDHEGEGYEHFQYTPYGESWISEQLGNTVFTMTHRFTGQELDPETGLYAFPARNYDPRTGRWLSVDPAMEEYLPIAPTSDQAREHNQNLPGMGGVFTSVNLQIYHYGANNPLKYVDPTGMTNETGGSGANPDEDVPLVHLKVGVRGAATIGGEAGVGLVINPNNLWDSGVSLTLGVGLGAEIAVDVPGVDDALEAAASVVMGAVDLTRPTESRDLEGVTTKVVAGAILGGISWNVDGNPFTEAVDLEPSGIEVLSAGGGLYRTGTTVVTAGEVVEAGINALLSPLIFLRVLRPVDVDGIP